MSDYLSIFGFDFLKTLRRKPADDQPTQASRRSAAKLSSDEDRVLDSEHPEVILWGMYPIY